MRRRETVLCSQLVRVRHIDVNMQRKHRPKPKKSIVYRRNGLLFDDLPEDPVVCAETGAVYEAAGKANQFGRTALAYSCASVSSTSTKWPSAELFLLKIFSLKLELGYRARPVNSFFLTGWRGSGVERGTPVTDE